MDNCRYEQMSIAYSLRDWWEYLRGDSLFYSRGFDTKKEHPIDIVFTLDDRAWFDRMIEPILTEVDSVTSRLSPFEERYIIRRKKTVEGYSEFNANDLIPNDEVVFYFAKYIPAAGSCEMGYPTKTDYKNLRIRLGTFVRDLFIKKWLEEKHAPEALLIATERCGGSRSLLLTTVLNMCGTRTKRRRGWY